MASVTITGRFAGRDVGVRWEDGVVTGDPILRAAIRRVAEEGDPVGLTPVGPWYPPGQDTGWQFCATVKSLVEKPNMLAVDLPDHPQVPEGARA
jgi:hypothetical protein